MAQLIVERATLINHLLPQEELRTELAEHVLTAMIDMFYVYLIKAQLPQIEAAFQWVSTLFLILRCTVSIRDVTKFEFEFDDVRTSNVFTKFEIRRMF